MDLKKSQNWHFSQRGQSMVLAKIIKILYFFFLGKIRPKKVFGNVLDRKLAFLDYKNMDFKKVAKLAIFQRGQPMVSTKIMKFLYLFFLGKIRQKKVFGNVLDRKLAFLDYTNMDLKKVAKLAFLQRGQPMVLAKIMKFLYVFFLGNTRQKKVFANVQDRKLAFLHYKNMV